MSATGKARRKAKPMPTKGIYDPPKSDPLAGLSPDQIENPLLRSITGFLRISKSSCEY